jgi:membrane-associated phospholipid phosphatase
MEDRLFRAFVIGTVAVMLSSYLVYIFYPTYVVRPQVGQEGFLYDLLRYVYGNDRDNNAFPSGHTYTTVLIALFWWRWKPRLWWLWVTIAVIIVLSTLFTAQHHSPDPLGGILWAFGGYYLGMWWVKRRDREA